MKESMKHRYLTPDGPLMVRTVFIPRNCKQISRFRPRRPRGDSEATLHGGGYLLSPCAQDLTRHDDEIWIKSEAELLATRPEKKMSLFVFVGMHHCEVLPPIPRYTYLQDEHVVSQCRDVHKDNDHLQVIPWQ